LSSVRGTKDQTLLEGSRGFLRGQPWPVGDHLQSLKGGVVVQSLVRPLLSLHQLVQRAFHCFLIKPRLKNFIQDIPVLINIMR
jgi:hypothetical protein